MPSAAAYGRSLDARLKAVVKVHEEALQAARKAGDTEKEKFVLEGCQYIDSLAKGAYSLSQDLDTLPEMAKPLKGMSKAAAARVFEASVRALEARAAKIKGAGPVEYIKQSMGAAQALVEEDFYPDKEFTLWNPLDWYRAAKYEAYRTLQQGLNAAQQVEQTVTDSAGNVVDTAAEKTFKYATIGIALALGAYAIKKNLERNHKPK